MSTNFSGIWLFNHQKSHMRAQAPELMVITIDHREPHIFQHVQTTTADGVEQGTAFEFIVGAEVVNNVGGLPVRTTATWKGDELVVESSMKTAARELHFRDYWSVSDNGLTLTMAHRDDDLVGQVSVLEKRLGPE